MRAARGVWYAESIVMPRNRDILSALRAVAVWLLMVSVFFGPAGLAASSASGPKACEVSCPCDEAEQDEHDEQDEHSDEDPCDGEAADGHEDDEECPEDCPSCGCGAGAAMTMVALTLQGTSLPSSSDLTLAQSDSFSSGVRSGVFRPPRALS